MRHWILLAPLLIASPALAQAPGPKPIDQLLTALQSAPSEEVAALLETRIEHIWLEAGSPAVDLLMSRGMREMHAGAPSDAEEDFDAAIALDPNYAEAWHRRAIARFQSGDTLGAIGDLGEVLQREPRNFAALDTLERLSEAQEDWKGAYAAWQKKLEIDPKTPGGEEKLKDLRRRALGDDT
jgi:tetratricopeptide (TPR) repeat protein